MLHFREVEERSRPFTLGSTESCIVVVEVETKVHKATSCRLTINDNMSLRQVPTSWTHKKLGYVAIIELVDSVPRLIMESYAPIHSIFQVHLTPYKVLPAW